MHANNFIKQIVQQQRNPRGRCRQRKRKRKGREWGRQAVKWARVLNRRVYVMLVLCYVCVWGGGGWGACGNGSVMEIVDMSSMS